MITLRLPAAFLVVLSTLLALAAQRLAAQPAVDPMVGGVRYVVAFPDTTRNTFDARYPNTRFEDKAVLLIYSAVDNHITIKGKGFSIVDKLILGGRVSAIDLSGGVDGRAPNPLVTEHCKPVDNAFTVDAEFPVILYQYLVTKFGTEAWTPLPVAAWGHEYYAAAIPGEIGSDISPGGEFDYNRKNKMFPAEILVIAAYDNTRITIVPNGPVHLNCQATNITLKAGEVYQIQSYVDTLTANIGGDQPDFGGSRIFSTKPVGVISGNTRAQVIDENVGLGKNIFKNMLIEWLSPSEQHGTEFVFLPTWDGKQLLGLRGEDPAEKRKAEFIRVYGTREGETEVSYTDSAGVAVTRDRFGFPLVAEQGKFVEIRVDGRFPSLVRTSKPAQVMSHASAVVKYAGTTQGFGGYIGAAYDGWGAHMTDIVPRHRWTSFLPFYASTHPAGMVHFIAVVTDSSHRGDVFLKNGASFVFQNTIAGTDLIWGTMSVTPGIDNWIEGRNGAKVWGRMYGTFEKGGHEEYRPGSARGRDEAPPSGASGGGDPSLMHPSEYEEYLAIAYSFPLAASFALPGAGDSLAITSVRACTEVTYTARALNENPVGLSDVQLRNAVNARIGSVNPFPVTGSNATAVTVEPVAAAQDASATVLFIDRTGRTTEATYVYTAERLAVGNRVSEDFGIVRTSDTVRRQIVVTNETATPVELRSVRLRTGAQFQVVVNGGPLPRTLAPGASTTIEVITRTGTTRGTYSDMLELELGCRTESFPLLVRRTAPCMAPDDLDFGSIPMGGQRSMELRLCNSTPDTVVFGSDPATVVTLGSPNFTVSDADRQALAGLQLPTGGCISIQVLFTAGDSGVYRTTATFATNSVVTCRDSSRLTARVEFVNAAPDDVRAGDALTMALEPNPFVGSTEVRFAIPRGAHTTVTVHDARGGLVGTLVDGFRAAGEHRAVLDAHGLPAGVYHVRIVSGDLSLSRVVVKR